MSDTDTASLSQQRVNRWLSRLANYERLAKDSPGPAVEGVLRRVIGMTMEAEGCQAPVGGRCHVVSPDGARYEAEVVGFAGEKLFLMPTGDMRGMIPNARIIPIQRGEDVKVGDELLGRVIDGAGQPLDGRGPVQHSRRVRLAGSTINPLARQPIREPLDVGIRAINSLLTVGRGQRVGLFAGSGVGKSRLLGMMTRFTSADVTVVGLIGERGREVKEFIEDVLGPEGMHRA
ncbi:MAG: flagellum-specific ATP synthase FliI, partial [Gammaproteobacteria bacterium]|nr:flagellum-specific ATP synthase FliI [Gammaproteobacteria bacterium]